MSTDYTIWLGDTSSLINHLKIQDKIYNTPAPDLRRMVMEAQQHALRSAVFSEDGESREDEDEFGEHSHMVTRINDVAVVNVSGNLVSKDSWVNSFFGLVSYNEIRNAVFSALDHADVNSILINSDTPGGSASGISELSDFLSKVNSQGKPIYSYTATEMLSGGYWLSSVGRRIFAGKVASIGSIGVISVHLSMLDAMRKAGVEPTVIRKGEFKALGNPYEKLGEKARVSIESQMGKIYDIFLDVVSEARGMSIPSLIESAAEGRVFIGEDAVTVGLVDNIASFDDTVLEVSDRTKKSNSSSITNNYSTEAGVDIMSKKKVLTEAAVGAIASGVPEQTVLEDENLMTPVEGEEADSEVSNTPEGKEGSDDAEGTPAAKVEETPNKDDKDGTSMSLNSMVEKLTDLAVTVADLKSQKAALETALETSKSLEDSMRKIVVDATNRMQITLGGTLDKMEGLSSELVVRQHHRVLSQFNSKYKVGALAETPTEEDLGVKATERSNLPPVAKKKGMTLS